MSAKVWLFPYMMLDRRERIGPWRLIPRRRLRPQDVVAPWMRKLVRGLGDMYEPPETARDPLRIGRYGCFVARQRERLGAAHDLDEMSSLRLAVTAALLDSNPTSKDKNSAHVVSTSDNATLYGHRITADAHVSAQYGAMAKTLIGGYTIGDKAAAIRAPAELHLPLFGTTLDAEYARAIYRLLRKGDALAGGLERAIQWLDLAWKNTTSIRPEVRIVVLRFGLEALLSQKTSDKLFVLAASLSTLLDPPGAPKSRRSWSEPLSDPRAQDPCTELQWWFVEFSLLRNDIAHGKAVRPARYKFNGEHHVMLGERALRKAIKETVVPHATALLRLTAVDRSLKRAVARAYRTRPSRVAAAVRGIVRR